MSDRLINATAEAALLGGLMLDNKLILEVSDRVKPDHFGDPLHGQIFSAMQKFSAKGMLANALTLRPLFLHNQDAQNGAYLDQLVESEAVMIGAASIADQVADLAARRIVRQALMDARTSLEDDLERPVDEITSMVESAGWAAAAGQSSDDEPSDAAEMIGMVEARDDRINNDPGEAGMSNALIDEIDQGLGYLETGTYNILAGRPGMGKSAAAQSMALGYSMNGHPSLYIQLEMKKEQMGIRLASDAGFALGYKLTASALRKGGLSPYDRQDLADIRRKVKTLPLKFITPGNGVDIMRIWSLVARQKAVWKAAGRDLRFVVIDYLGLIGACDSQGRYIDDERKRMNAVSKIVKRMASDLDVCILALAQLSRNVEARQDKRPMLSDLKASGDLEQDADSVTMVYRKEYYLQQAEPARGAKQGNVDLHEEWEVEIGQSRDKVDFIFAKNRHGRSTSKTARFLSDFVCIRSGDVDPYADQPAMF